MGALKPTPSSVSHWRHEAATTPPLHSTPGENIELIGTSGRQHTHSLTQASTSPQNLYTANGSLIFIPVRLEFPDIFGVYIGYFVNFLVNCWYTFFHYNFRKPFSPQNLLRDLSVFIIHLYFPNKFRYTCNEFCFTHYQVALPFSLQNLSTLLKDLSKFGVYFAQLSLP